MVQVQYKPYKFLVKNIVLKKGIFINNIEYYAIKYKTNNDYNNWVVQTPLLFIPFDMTRYEGNNNYLDLSFLSHEYDTDISTFLKFVIKVNKIFKNNKKFKRYKFKNSLKEDNTSFFPERLRVNYNKNNNVLIFNEENKKIDITELKSKIYGKFLIQISNIWINKTKKEYGIIWNISQMKLSTNLIYSPNEFAFIEDEDEPEKKEDISAENPKYKHYFFMKKIGLDINTIKHKLTKDNLDPGIADIIFETKKPKTETIYNTIKKPDIVRPNFLSMIGGDIKLKKIKIVKKKYQSPKNNLIPSQEDIQSALSNLRKT